MLYKIKNINHLIRKARKKSEKKGWRRSKWEEMQHIQSDLINNYLQV